MTKKRFLLALALMLTAVGGAWAQGNTRYASGSVDAATLQVGDTLCEGVTITGNGNNYLTLNIGRWKMSGNVMQASTMKMFPVTLGTGASIDDWGDIYTPVTEGGEDGDAWLVTSIDNGCPYLSGILLPQPPAGTLVEDGNNQWHLTTPAGNVTLSVTYYGQYRLDSIPQGWQVKVNGSLMGSDTLKTYTDGGNPQMRYIAAINETDSVELLPPDSLKDVIKSVRLVDNSTPPAPATVLSGALVDGATIKVNFKWRGSNEGDYVQGVYNAASGTFTASKGGLDWGDDERAVYKVEKSGDNIIIGAGFSGYDIEGMVWTFNTTNDTYTTTNGSKVNQYPEVYGLISVTLNGTDITSQLTAQ